MLSLIAMFVVTMSFYLIFPYYQVIIKKKKYDKLKFNKINFLNSIIITIICLIIIFIFELEFKYFCFLPLFSFLMNDFILEKHIEKKEDKKSNKQKITYIIILNIISLPIYMIVCVMNCFYNKGLIDYTEMIEYFSSFSSCISLILLIIESLAVFFLLKYLLIKKINKKNFILYGVLSIFIFFLLYDLAILDFRMFAAANFGYGYEALVFKYIVNSFYIYYIITIFINLLFYRNKKVMTYIISLTIFILISTITSFHFKDDVYIIHPTCNYDYYCISNDFFSKGNVYFDYSSDDTEEAIGTYRLYYNIPFINKIVWIKEYKIRIYNIHFYENNFTVSGFGEKYSFEQTDDDYTIS